LRKLKTILIVSVQIVSVENKRDPMKIRKKDFMDIFLFSLISLSIISVSLILLINLIYFAVGEIIPLSSSFSFLLTFEIFSLILSPLFGVTYITWFYEYKIDPDGKERKIKKH